MSLEDPTPEELYDAGLNWLRGAADREGPERQQSEALVGIGFILAATFKVVRDE
jgi:hypothetical protein